MSAKQKHFACAGSVCVLISQLNQSRGVRSGSAGVDKDAAAEELEKRKLKHEAEKEEESESGFTETAKLFLSVLSSSRIGCERLLRLCK